MFVGREKELYHMNHFHRKVGMRILVLYGPRGIGKTTLLKEFLKQKEYFYYEAPSCCARQHKKFMVDQMQEMGMIVREEMSFREIFEVIERSGRNIFVIDEMQNMGKTESEFFKELVSYLKKEKNDLFFVFSTSWTGWAENTLKKRNDEFSLLVNEFYRVGELKYLEFREYFPGFSREDSIGAYGILGGIPGLWKWFSDGDSLQKNIEKNFLQKDSRLLEFVGKFLEELRETAVYNTILLVLAEGKYKLNDLYLNTGFSRAKISVYLKNLIQLQLVEKVNTAALEEGCNGGKGLYEISVPYLSFYYCYIFPNWNKIGVWEAGKIYEEKIAPTLKLFTAEAFRKVCFEFLEKENASGRLPEEFAYVGKWIGKAGNIDFIFRNKEKEILTGICNWEQDIMRYEDYGLLLKSQESAGIEAEYVTLFSRGKFDNRLRMEQKKNPYVALVSLEDMV